MSKKNLKKTKSSIFQTLTAKKTATGECLSEIFSYYEGKETSDEIHTSNFDQDKVQESFLKNHLTIEQLFGKLKKKCLVTRMKGLQTLKGCVEELQVTGKMSIYVKEFLRIYVSNALFDINPDLRILFHETLNAFIHVMKSSFDVYKKVVFPTVWCSCQDIDERVAKEAQITLKLLLVEDTASNVLNVLSEHQSELINFILTILSLNEASFSKHIWIPLNAKHMDTKLIKERRNEVIVSTLSSLNVLFLRVNQNQNTFVIFLSHFKIFFSKKLCLRQFFNCQQFSVLVAMKSITFVSNLFESMHALQGNYEKCRAKLLFQDDKIYHEMLRSSLSLFLPQNQELLKVAPRLFVVTVQIHPDILEESENVRIWQRDLPEQILNIVRHQCYTRTLPENISFYNDIPYIIKAFPNSFLMSSCSAVFIRKLLYCLFSTFKKKEEKETRNRTLPDCVIVFQCYYKVLVMVLNLTQVTVEMKELQAAIVSFFFWVPFHMMLRVIISSVKNSECYMILPMQSVSNLSDNSKEVENPEMFFITLGRNKNDFSSLLVKLIFEDTIKNVSDELKNLSLHLQEILTHIYEELTSDIQSVTNLVFVQISSQLIHFFTYAAFLKASCIKEVIERFQASLINHSLSLFFDYMTQWGLNPSLPMIPLYCAEINKILTNVTSDVYSCINWDSILYKNTPSEKNAEQRIHDMLQKTVGTYMNTMQVLTMKTPVVSNLNEDCMSITFASCFRHVVETVLNVYGSSQHWKGSCMQSPNVLNIYVSVIFPETQGGSDVAPCLPLGVYGLFFCYPYIDQILKHVENFYSMLYKKMVSIWNNLLERLKREDEDFFQGTFQESLVYYLDKVVKTAAFNCKDYLKDVARRMDDIFTISCTLNGSSINLFNVKILVLKEYFRCVQAYANSEKPNIEILKNIPMFCLRMSSEAQLLIMSEDAKSLSSENMKAMLLLEDLKSWVHETYTSVMLLFQTKESDIYTTVDKNQLFLLYNLANELGSIPCNVWIEGVSLVYNFYCTVKDSAEKTHSLPLFWSWVDHFFTITQAGKNIAKGSFSETIGLGSYLMAFYCYVKQKEQCERSQILGQAIRQSALSSFTPFQWPLKETNKADNLYNFVVSSWISFLFANNAFYFSHETSSEQMCCMVQYRSMLECVLIDVFFNNDSFNTQSRENVLQCFNLFLHHIFRKFLEDSNIVSPMDASWFFDLLTDVFHLISSILVEDTCMDASCSMKALTFFWWSVLSVFVKDDKKEITFLWDQAIQESPKLVYDVMTVSSYFISFCCEKVFKKKLKDSLVVNACDSVEGTIMTKTALYFVGKIGWSLSCLSDTTLVFDETIQENIIFLKISLRVLACTFINSYESLDSEPLNERLLLVLETCMHHCFKKNETTYVAWCTELFQCIEASMNYMYLFHFFQDSEEDHSKTLSSCLFILTHFFSLHTEWIRTASTCLKECVFLPHCVEYLSYCLVCFLENIDQLFLQSILASLEQCFLNIQAVFDFCKVLDSTQTKLWIKAFAKLCTCIEKCWETKFHNFFYSIHENDIISEQQSKICLALTRFYSLLLYASTHWTYLQDVQKNLWALLFSIRYPLFKWPFLQDSRLVFRLENSPESERLEENQLCLKTRDGCDTFQYIITLRRKCIDNLFDSFQCIENKDSNISSNSFKALATCLYLFLGRDIAKEILTCPNKLIVALKQTTNQKTSSNHETTWDQLLRHLYVWFVVLKEFQQNSAESVEVSQYNASLFLHIPFHSLYVSEPWFDELRDCLCQIPSFVSSWNDISHFYEEVSNTPDENNCKILQPNNLLQALIDLLSLLILLQDEIPHCFSLERKQSWNTKGLEICQLKMSEICDQFLSSFKTFPLACFHQTHHTLFKDQHSIPQNIPAMIQDGSTQIENFWNGQSSQYLEHIPNFFKECSESWHKVWILSIQLMYVLAQIFPIALRMYACSSQSVWMTSKHIKALHVVFQKIISPSLILRDAASICALEKIGTTNVKASVQFNKKLRQLCLTFINKTQEIFVTFTVQFPDIYPLRCVDFKYNQSVAVPKLKFERWLITAKQILMGGKISKSNPQESSEQPSTQPDLCDLSFKQHAHEPQTNCLLSCITFIKDNFAAFVLGLEDCFICYSIIHHRTRGIPKSQCITCKYKFHAECVQKWFKTSLKNNCPLCQSPFR